MVGCERRSAGRYRTSRAGPLQGVGPATIPVVLTLGATPYDYDGLLIGISFRYLIGNRVPTLADDE